MSEKVNNENNKRGRCANYSEEDERLLLKCVLRKSHILECRKTDSVSNNAKQKAWAELTKEFNSLGPNYIRDESQLRGKYKSIKKTLRQNIAAERHERKKTGGGKAPQEWEPRSDEMQQLAATISLSIHGLKSSFDDDAEQENSSTSAANNSDTAKKADPLVDNGLMDKECDTTIEVVYVEDHSMGGVNLNEIGAKSNENSPLNIETSTTNNPSSRTVSVSDWSKGNPAMLRKPQHPLLKRSKEKRKLFNDSADLMEKKMKLLESELELTELRKKFAIEEHKLRRKHAREEHAVRIQYWKEKSRHSRTPNTSPYQITADRDN